jgi:hypothetical protein
VGLAWRCVPDDELMTSALEMARRAARLPPALSGKLRNTMSRMERIDEYASAVQIEMDEQLWSLRQTEAIQAIAARMQEIGYVSPEPLPPPPPPPTEPPPPEEPARPGEPGFKLFSDD